MRRAVSPKALAEALGVHVETVRRWLRAGKVPSAAKVGGVWRVLPDALKDKGAK